MAATMSTRSGALSARSGLSGSRKLKASLAGTVTSKNTEFLRLVERTEGAFVSADDSGVDEVRRILEEVRRQYDHVHLEAEKREADLTRLREAVRVADQSHSTGADESSKKEDLRSSLEKQYADTCKAITEAQTAKKVYNHMFGRIQKESSLLKEKLLLMEAHLGRKGQDSQRKMAMHERLIRKGGQTLQDLDILEHEIEHEKQVREEAKFRMEQALKAKADAKERRMAFGKWRHEVALDAANEAFNASAGRLRKLHAVEKLAGNCLQKITFEQVERSQTTEDGFQRIREVTGLTDVMDIVHKFLNREVEQEQLKSSVKEAEVRKEALQEDFEKLRTSTDGMTFDQDPSSRSRTLYMEVEEHEAKLNQVLKEHEQSRQRLQQSTLQVEHMKRWCKRMGSSLKQFEPCVEVEKPADLPVYFSQMQRAVDKFIAHIVQQISSGKVQRKNMSQVASKEYHEARRLLADKDFLKVNCRVPASLDAGRPQSRQGQGTSEEDSQDAHQLLRGYYKNESSEMAKKYNDLAKKNQQEQQKKQKPK